MEAYGVLCILINPTEQCSLKTEPHAEQTLLSVALTSLHDNLFSVKLNRSIISQAFYCLI